MEVVAEVVTEVVVASTAVVCPVPPVSIIETVISLLEIRRICSLKGFMSFEDRATVTSTFAVPSAIAVGLKDVSATLPDAYAIVPTLFATTILSAPEVLKTCNVPSVSCNSQPVLKIPL